MSGWTLTGTVTDCVMTTQLARVEFCCTVAGCDRPASYWAHVGAPFNCEEHRPPHPASPSPDKEESNQ